MLSIAKAARASNETLYRWYGDKVGLFETMVQDNVSETETLLRAAIDDESAPMTALRNIAPIFMKMLLGDRAILLNRVAASDSSGELGAAISKGGRAVIQPLFSQLLRATGKVPEHQLALMTRTLVSLLVGDSQIKRVIGVMPPLDEEQIKARCALALEQFEVLLEANTRD